MTADATRFRDLLMSRKSDLIDLSDTSADARKPVQLDQSMIGRLSRIDAMQDREMALATERRRQQETLRIEAALKRMETGDYGYCLSCGEEIELRRLELDPAVTVCIDCAR
jgi:DnaK suppressor protein